MIPKIIHLCWLSGDPYPRKIQDCLDSWKKHLPSYEIILWDTKRFNIHEVPWVEQAFNTKKYAFAADYIRLYALYHHGGIYLDSDVEILKSLDNFLELPYFVGAETSGTIEEPKKVVTGSNAAWIIMKDEISYVKTEVMISVCYRRS